jgi:hypothetical protein
MKKLFFAMVISFGLGLASCSSNSSETSGCDTCGTDSVCLDSSNTTDTTGQDSL